MPSPPGCGAAAAQLGFHQWCLLSSKVADVHDPAQVNFVRAERSVFKWAAPIIQQIQDLGHHVRALPLLHAAAELCAALSANTLQSHVETWGLRLVLAQSPEACMRLQVHLLPDAGHWVHTDNPEGLLRILAPSLGSARL